MIATLVFSLILAFLGGLLASCLASFAFVVGERPVRNESIVYIDSHCTSCGKKLRIIDNIPIFGWLLNNGRSHCCGATIPTEYVIGETIIFFMGAVATLSLIKEPLPYTASSFNEIYVVLLSILLLAVWWRVMTQELYDATFRHYIVEKTRLEKHLIHNLDNSYTVNVIASHLSKRKQ